MIKVEDFLLPVSPDGECGEYLRYDSVYDQIMELRREDDANLSQGIWQTEAKKANWPEVLRLCSELLLTRTKDLQIAMWLLESLTALYGFSGLNQGVTLVKSLSEKFWDNIYPTIDSANKSAVRRASPFYFFAEKIRERIVLIPLTNPSDGVLSPHSLADWMTARRNLQIKNSRGLSLKQIEKNVAVTPLEFFEALGKEVNELQEKLKSLNDFLNEKCSEEAPSFHEIFSCLKDIEHVVSRSMAGKKSSSDASGSKDSGRMNAAETQQVDEDQQISDGSSEATAASCKTLDGAYENLVKIAAFLEKEQPQSPSATLIKIASAIGNKTFQELLEINMQNGTSVIHAISELRGLLSSNSSEANNPNS
ncbi:MAG: type VI secretion system protein TssA [Holosporaceae bacterium]|jgi:type VI secretion system ImpA family protein|nr:type VI secretion system protein TssA [Holosporaceae bacterium]